MPANRTTRSSSKLIKKPSYYRELILDSQSTSDDETITQRRNCKRKAQKSENIMKTSSEEVIRNERNTDSEDEISTHNYSSIDGAQGTPPKLRKQQQKVIDNLVSPSRLIDRLSIDDESDNENTNEVQQTRNKYQSAKISLACTETNDLPGRENEIKQLCDFMLEHLNNMKSGSLYVSGQPGTGKTACLSNILKNEDFANRFKKLYVNCTSVSSIGAVYKKICSELNLKPNGKTEKDCLNAIEKFITSNRKMTLLVLDEVDQLVGTKQSVLYTIFEWPSKPKAKILIIGIANSLDLTDRLLTRLSVRCELKPKLLHFAPYTKQQIIDIFKSRLEAAGVMEIFPPATIQLLAAKVAAISGDVRKALDIGRRVIEITSQQKESKNLECILDFGIDGVNPLKTDENENEKQQENENVSVQPIQVKQVVDLLGNIYGASQNLRSDIEDLFPLQQKILICTLMLMLKKGKSKDITIGRLYDVYKRICQKRNIVSVDQAEFYGICSLIEIRGIIRVVSKKEPRLSRVFLQWDDEEVTGALKDKQLIATILEDVSCLGK